MATLLSVVLSFPVVAEAQPAPGCEPCHGEIEFLRQHVSTLEEAEALLAPAGALAASAHGELGCADCHVGLPRYPHGDVPPPTPCATCHEATEQEWSTGLHALDEAAACTDCHGVHDVLTKEALGTPEGIRYVREACRSCHFEVSIAAVEPHRDSLSCAGCHEAHATLASDDEEARTHALNQAGTCGACHEDASAAWGDDAHGGAVPGLVHPDEERPRGEVRMEPPACSACHGADGILARSDTLFVETMVQRCSECHEPYAESFADSYHGQAHGLGSVAVASCQDCHGSHGIHPADDPRSLVGEARLLETCQSCHPDATAGFALFQPHADHSDREKYPYVYWSYHLMTALLIGVFTVFGAHTFFWLVRLGFDALRGSPHGATHDAGD
jgi:hypothetical protein